MPVRRVEPEMLSFGWMMSEDEAELLPELRVIPA